MFLLILKSFIIGFIMPIPIGPLGLLCIRRTLSDGIKFGIASGLGIATVDGFYAALSTYGSSFIYNFFIQHKFILQLIGSLFLIFLGVKTFFSRSDKEAHIRSTNSLFHSYLSTLFITLSNPANLLAFVIVFTAFRVTLVESHLLSLLSIIIGVASGSILWYIILCWGVDKIRFRFTERWLKIFHHVCGVLILASVVILFLIDYFI